MGPSSPYCEDICKRYCCLTTLFPIVDTCLSCEDIARQSCVMVLRWRFLASCISASHVQHVSDLHPKFALKPHHVCKYVDIQSATAEIRRGKKKKKKPQGKNILSASAMQGGHNYSNLVIAKTYFRHFNWCYFSRQLREMWGSFNNFCCCNQEWFLCKNLEIFLTRPYRCNCVVTLRYLVKLETFQVITSLVMQWFSNFAWPLILMYVYYPFLLINSF